MDQILIVEDEASLGNSLLRCLQTQLGVEVSGAATLRDARRIDAGLRAISPI